MKILYGVNGTGNGHITKSSQIIKTLESRGHEVDILISGQNKNLHLPFKPKWQKAGFTFSYKNGAIDLFKTIRETNLNSFFKDLELDLFEYDKICTDFEPITAWASKLSGRDSIGISHQYSFLSDKVPRPHKKDLVAELFMKYFSPTSNPIGLHFLNYDKDIYHPILRDDVIKGISFENGHVLVYLPSYSKEVLVNHFSNFKNEIHIFTKTDKQERFGKLLINPLSEATFLESLLTCDLVITAAGFELPSEALYLGIKMICISIEGQYEQACNAAALNKLGVRTINKLEQLKDLSCEKIGWQWINPLDNIISIIESQHL